MLNAPTSDTVIVRIFIKILYNATAAASQAAGSISEPESVFCESLRSHVGGAQYVLQVPATKESMANFTPSTKTITIFEPPLSSYAYLQGINCEAKHTSFASPYTSRRSFSTFKAGLTPHPPHL
jgi:hypothetical protein